MKIQDNISDAAVYAAVPEAGAIAAVDLEVSTQEELEGSCFGTFGSVGTFGSATGCLGSAGTAGTFGSMEMAD